MLESATVIGFDYQIIMSVFFIVVPNPFPRYVPVFTVASKVILLIVGSYEITTELPSVKLKKQGCDFYRSSITSSTSHKLL